MNSFKSFLTQTLLFMTLMAGYAFPEESSEKSDKKAEEPPKIGNFSLRASQQPGPLVSFGDNIIDKGEIQVFLFADALLGKKIYMTDIFPSFLYGVTESLSVSLNVPFSPGNQDRNHRSSGLEDAFVQLEYQFYSKSTVAYVDQATVVGSVSFPTGNYRSIPPLGFAANGYFIGLTYNRMTADWFYFTSQGVLLTATKDGVKRSKDGTRFGNQILYEFGIGRNISSRPGWIFAWMVELDGFYVEKNKLDGKLDPNSGGNTIYLIPSLWISSEKLIVQFGVGGPIYQNLFGKQRKKSVIIDFNLGITF